MCVVYIWLVCCDACLVYSAGVLCTELTLKCNRLCDCATVVPQDSVSLQLMTFGRTSVLVAACSLHRSEILSHAQREREETCLLSRHVTRCLSNLSNGSGGNAIPRMAMSPHTFSSSEIRGDVCSRDEGVLAPRLTNCTAHPGAAHRSGKDSAIVGCASCCGQRGTGRPPSPAPGAHPNPRGAKSLPKRGEDERVIGFQSGYQSVHGRLSMMEVKEPEVTWKDALAFNLLSLRPLL
ncbi:uncharacterized protein LOC119586067 isoform X2 [Penaeus monodon]|uniref:uncharacterized protein LOC119586067 isoform X2 n=1 Tax=Penaeus monodon TaxID=6687 RepID=UPI0018A711A7|nr:uncharacterized protein LOC119586067 isoform X2 [Penaeus monodon]